jgi:hypothetical protein
MVIPGNSDKILKIAATGSVIEARTRIFRADHQRRSPAAMDKKSPFPVLPALLLLFSPLVFAPAVQAGSLDAAQAASEIGERRGGQDPLVGNWECSNGVYTWAIFFQANGTLIQQEPTFGNTRNTSWTRVSDQEVILGGGQVLTVTMDGDDEMNAVENKVGATWDCSRK